MEDKIEKSIRLKAPVSRVWRALTDHKEFGIWFGVIFENGFTPGRESHGQITIAGYEHIKMSIRIMKMEPERLFSFTWHPYAIDPERDYSREEPTHVTFQLADHGEETQLTVTETGFGNIPPDRRLEAFRMNEQGWTGQVENIRNYVEA